MTATGVGIADLTGLEAAANLTSLTIFDNQISDLNPLANLTGLLNLFLGGNQIVDLSPLAGLTGLQRVFLNGNFLRNIDVLSGLTSPLEVEVQDNLLIVSGGSSARLVVDGLLSAEASVTYEPQDDAFAGLPLLDDLKDALEPIWVDQVPDSSGNAILQESPGGITLVQSGPANGDGNGFALFGYASSDRDWRTEIDISALPAVGDLSFPSAPGTQILAMGFQIRNNSDSAGDSARLGIEYAQVGTEGGPMQGPSAATSGFSGLTVNSDCAGRSPEIISRSFCFGLPIARPW